MIGSTLTQSKRPFSRNGRGGLPIHETPKVPNPGDVDFTSGGEFPKSFPLTQNLDRQVELSVSGKHFATALSTLVLKSGYFKTMFASGPWRELLEKGKAVRVDRGYETDC
jgi:hypothetical protein